MVAYVKRAIKMREYGRTGINGQLLNPPVCRESVSISSLSIFAETYGRTYLFHVITGVTLG